jgi:hypothetical protein
MPLPPEVVSAAAWKINVAARPVEVLHGANVGAHGLGRIDRARLGLPIAGDLFLAEDLGAAQAHGAHVVLDAFADGEDHVGLAIGAVHARGPHFGVDVPAALVEFTDGGRIGLQALGIEAAGLGQKAQEALGLGFDHLGDVGLLDGRVAFKLDRTHIDPVAFGDLEGDPRGAQLFVHVGRGAHGHFREALARVVINDLLPVGLHGGFIEGFRGLGGNLLAHPARAQAAHPGNQHLADLRLGLDDHDDLDAVGLGLAEDEDLGDVSRGVEIADVILDGALIVSLAHARLHVGEDLLAGDGGRPGVLDFDGLDDGGLGLLGQGSGRRKDGGEQQRERREEGAKIHWRVYVGSSTLRASAGGKTAD